MAPNGRNNRNALLFMGAFDSSSSSESSTRNTTPPAQPRLQHALPVLPATTYTMPAPTTSAFVQSNNRAVEASALPPAYSVAGRAPIYTPIDPHRDRTPAFVSRMPPHGTSDALLPTSSSSANEVIVQTEFDGLFSRLQQDFVKHAAETTKLETLKTEQAAKVASDEVKLGRIREGLFSQQRHLNVELENIKVEQARLAGDQAKVQREKEVAAAQYATAAKIQEGNEGMRSELMELARRLEVREKSLREKEKTLLEKEKSLSGTEKEGARRSPSPSPSSTAALQHANNLPPSGLLAANFPLTIEQDTLHGLHSEVPTVNTPTTPRMPSTGSHTLRRSSTVVRKVSYNNLTLWGERGLAAKRAATEQWITNDDTAASITGDSPSKQSVDEPAHGAQFCELRHTSSERRDRQRGRSIRRVSGTMSLRDGALWLD